ncbi:MAG: hypothetical protein LBS22_02855 [Puniceicoccales bacterium]|nr:hypothetical protein [Puniceicoccales bacterium]
MSKKVFIGAVMSCLVLCPNFGIAAPLNGVVNERKNSPQTWTIDNSTNNKITFEGDGSIGGEGFDGGTAASVEFGKNEEGKEYVADEKKNSLLTLTFDNDASVLTEVDNPANRASKLNAHIHAVNGQINQSAVGINLAEGVNLAIGGANGHNPALVAHSSVTDGHSAAIAIWSMGANRVEISGAAALTAYGHLTASTRSAAEYSFSASTGVGAAVAGGTGTTNNLDLWLSDNNNLTATSSFFTSSPPDDLNLPFSKSRSAATGVGTAVAEGNGTADGLNVRFGNNNNLTATSSAVSDVYFSGSTGAGATAAHGNSMVRAMDVQFGNNNNLSTYCCSAASSGSTGIGATAAGGDSTVDGLKVRFGNDNRLSATYSSSSIYTFSNSFSNSASTGIGATAAHGNGMVRSLDVEFKDGNTLSATADAADYAMHSASTGIGVTSAESDTNTAADIDTLDVRFGNNNILSASSSVSSSGDPQDPSYSASTGIGAASAYSKATSTAANANNLNLRFGDRNTLTATSAADYSASTGIGTAATLSNATNTMAKANDLNVWFGNDNSLTAVASSSSNYSASTGIGATSTASNTTNTMANASSLDVRFGDRNTLTAVASAAANYSASTGIGATSAASSKPDTVANANSLDVRFGNNNNLTVSSSALGASGAFSASVGVGATVAYGNGRAYNLDVRFGDDNSLITAATTVVANNSNYSASTGIGTAAARGSSTVSGLNVRFGNNNTLVAVAFSTPTSSATTGIGAAAANADSTANAVTVNMNGSQTLGTLAYLPATADTKVNAFGADNTDKVDGNFGWRVGIFAAGQEIREGDEVISKALEQDSTVNILAVKLENNWAIADSIASATLGANQGSSNADYARAFALGNDFKIYIGGRANPSSHEFMPVPANGQTNVVNVIGAIGKGKISTATNNVVPGSSLTVGQGWTVHAFGPVENLEEIVVQNGSSLKTYGPLRNDVISGGEVTVYGQTNGVGTIEFRGGFLRLSTDSTAGEKFNQAIRGITGKITYVDPATKISYKGSDGKIDIVTTNYPWKGSNGVGQLILNGDDALKFHVDSSQPDTAIKTQLTGPDDKFEMAKGYIAADAGMANAITFNGGKLGIVNDDAGSSGRLPAHADFWLVRTGKNANIEAVGDIFGFDLNDGGKFEKIDDNLYKLTEAYEDAIFSKQIDSYAQWDEALDVWLFTDATNSASGLFVGTGETPHYAVASDYAKRHANGELATLTVAAHNLLTNAISDRLTSIKGCLTDPFIHAIYGHAHQDEIAGFGYNNNMGGFVFGLDDVWSFPHERYLRLGAIFAYVHGKTNFFGSATGLGKSASQDLYMVELFGAYESFNDKLLKTNVAIFLGYGYNSDELHRTDANFNAFGGKVRSHNIFLAAELVKNLYTRGGYQFGLWFQANCSHIAQQGYDEKTVAVVGAQHVSAVNHNLFTTVVGFNVEREIFDLAYADKKWLLSLKAGWECQVVRKHSDVTVTFDNNLGIGPIAPIFRFPSRHAAIGTITVSKRLNVNWTIVASYIGRFNRNTSAHTLSCGGEYSF